MMKRIISTLALSVFAMSFTATASADEDRRIYQQNKAQYISHAKAGEIAKAHVKGTAVKQVEFDHDRMYGAHFDVEIITAQGEYDVKVDAKSGKVISSKFDD
ncbi:PepSY domain-containing protein [Moraxella haemolytica]|uniref:PepSY domain-containing protein n=1 Tax=Moraxella TaxID=475 RepID=UPI002542E466|nr:PepSY domain-containing protein [Moraxella sp. ZY171148]WII95414.1 PepSY domain-containing protein [Moraxella sp. ZY171148]